MVGLIIYEDLPHAQLQAQTSTPKPDTICLFQNMAVE